MKKNSSLLILLFISLQNFGQNEQAQILVGPNIQVSNDCSCGHAELMLAANPKDSNFLLGGGHKWSAKGVQVTGYVSKDGGKSWTDFTPYSDSAFSTWDLIWDPQSAFDKDGRAFIMGHVRSKNNEGEKYGIRFYRSLDKGSTWEVSESKSLDGQMDYYDHSQLAIDQTDSKYAGNIYMSINAATTKGSAKFKDRGLPDRPIISFVRSTDHGKTFEGPEIVVIADEGAVGLVNTNTLVSSNGEVFVTYCIRKAYPPDPAADKREIYIISSTNGGISFSLPQKVSVQNDSYKILSGIAKWHQFAIDNKSEKYKDRIYCVYNDIDTETSQIVLTYSTDKGKTWSIPKSIASNLSGGYQFLPAVTVNPVGIVGVRWYNTLSKEHVSSRDYDDYDSYFTASIDGGETFLPAVKVSDKTSKTTYAKGLNELITPAWKRSADKQTFIIDFSSANTNQLSSNGDYMQFVSDAMGVFHDFWIDGRDGQPQQIYTSAIQVLEAGIKRSPINVGKKKLNQVNLATANKTLHTISEYVTLKMGPASYDTLTNLFSIPVRLKNISGKTIYGPIQLEIVEIDTNNNKEIIPVILNANNEKTGAGAKFIYLANNSGLLPGEETSAISWQARINVPTQHLTNYSDAWLKQMKKEKNWLEDGLDIYSIPDLRIKVTGYIHKRGM